MVSTPIVEDANLFVRKSGGELVTQLYAFTDPGGRAVCLRPEFTSAVIRYYLSLGDTADSPSRFQYFGPVFRYDPAESPGAPSTHAAWRRVHRWAWPTRRTPKSYGWRGAA